MNICIYIHINIYIYIIIYIYILYNTYVMIYIYNIYIYKYNVIYIYIYYINILYHIIYIWDLHKPNKLYQVRFAIDAVSGCLSQNAFLLDCADTLVKLSAETHTELGKAQELAWAAALDMDKLQRDDACMTHFQNAHGDPQSRLFTDFNSFLALQASYYITMALMEQVCGHRWEGASLSFKALDSFLQCHS